MSDGRPLRILYVAYPMLPVTRESCGGAEQVLWTLEAEMARRGHHTTVAACAGSHIAGRLYATGAPPLQPDCFEARDAEHATQILRMLADVQRSPERFDLIHDKSGSFWRHAAVVDAPVLATLHLPRGFYPAAAFDHLPANLFFNCVSESQRRTFSDLSRMLGVVRNGIRLEDFPAQAKSPPYPLQHREQIRVGQQVDDCLADGYLLWIGRICEEKGTHVAINVARSAGRHLVIAGSVYPFSYHQAYFDREIRPHVDDCKIRYVGIPDFAEKLDLMRRARALLLPSLVDETSSLVAMEAMACGTPVVAFRRGAIPEIVRHGETGFVVDSAEAMASAVERARDIDPLVCRAHVEADCAAGRMADEYQRLYARVARGSDQNMIAA